MSALSLPTIWASTVKRVTDEAHFTDDLGADWLDRLELMILIEDRFPAVEITDDDVDRIDVVGDLIRHIAGVGNDRRRRLIVERCSGDLEILVPRSASAVKIIPLMLPSTKSLRRTQVRSVNRTQLNSAGRFAHFASPLCW